MVEGLGIVLDEVIDQHGEVGNSLPQGWKINRHGIDAEEEVQPEGSLFDLAAEVSVGGGDEAGGDGTRFMSTDAYEGSVLEDLQEFGLDGNIEATDLIEEEGPLMSLLDAPQLGGHGSGEGTFFVSKQLSFQEGAGNCRTTDLYQGPSGAHGKRVEEADGNLFAGTTLSLNQDGDIGLGDALEFISDGQHCGCFPEDDVERRQTGQRGGLVIVDQGHVFLSRSTAEQVYSDS